MSQFLLRTSAGSLAAARTIETITVSYKSDDPPPNQTDQSDEAGQLDQADQGVGPSKNVDQNGSR